MAEYTWQARYNDGTTLNQIESDGTKNAYLDIERNKLESFSLLDENAKVVICVLFDDDGEKLVWTRRVYMRMSGESITSHIIGKKGEFILAVQSDGSVIARHNFKNDGLFDEVING